MHELGTIVYVIDTVEKLAAEQKLSKIGSVTLEVGEVSGIVYARKKSALLKETELKIENLAAVTFCQDCKQTYSTLEYAKICPHCGSANTFLVTGNEFNIKEIEAM